MTQAHVTFDGFPARHAFTVRHGGVSRAPYDSLNLGDHVGDQPASVAANRRIVMESLGFEPGQLRALRQVHGERIVDTRDDAAWAAGPPEADALTSIDGSEVLAIGVADCLPILFFDSGTGAAAAAHCGWRGTASRLAAGVVEAMHTRYGSHPSKLSVAIGPGIAGACYQVGDTVVDQFLAAGFPVEVARPDAAGRFRLDLAVANRWVLIEAGVDPERIHHDPSCTHCDADRFFSYRRDGVTGRHWALIWPASVGSMRHAASHRDHAAPPGARRMPLGSRADT